MRRAKPRNARDPEDTRARLLAAASAEFNTKGFHGTDTNRIARRAGFAPQTFYRHFEDKIAVFLAVYDGWWRAESAALRELFGTGKPEANSAARIAIAFHTRWRVFRRSLRHLAIEDKRVRAARAAARKEQIAQLRQSSGSRTKAARMFAALLGAERICDAVADGEFTDLGIPQIRQIALVAERMKPLIA